MKAIAMYLPQFHKVPENDAWWGEGFTDWRAMSSAKPLFPGHKQPKNPLNNYQYDLLKKETFIWQEKLMKKYHIYGLCMYHYWFKEGRRILEKPAENLLKWNDINIPFCFSWANESWGRSWSNISNQNVWANAFETEEEHTGNGLLLEQEYGNEKDWAKHFHYLLPFFQDPRYIKKDNKPVMLIYKQEDIHCLKEMCTVWNTLAVQQGFDGMYIIGNYCSDMGKDCLDAMIVLEPGTTIDRVFPERYADKNRMEVARYLPYENVYQESLKWQSFLGSKVYYGGFSNYDDTPRRGSAGIVIYNDTPEKFKIYLSELYAKNAVCGNEYVFINAWNEWGENMHLEPDEEYGYGFLEAVKYAEKHYSEETYKYTAGQKTKNFSDTKQKMINRYKQEADVFDKWLSLKEHHLEISKWLTQYNYKKVGIYGYGALGRHLLTQLKHRLKYVCCIDRNAQGLHLDVPVFLPSEIPQLDLIIVSNVHIYHEIAEELDRNRYDIMSLESLVENITSEA